MSEVLALKYRPKSFDKLIGQDIVSQTLIHALDQDRISHAYLFSGLRGSGKTSTARIFSKALICENGPSSNPCESCENCKLANENRHIDIIEMDGASSRKIDDIRSLIEQTKYKPNIARFKIFIIDEVHMLTREAFNALLKTLEEPPEYVKFILATTDPLKLPATILSRTQHFRFKKIAQSDVIKHLSYILAKEDIEYEKDALMMLSRAGNGSLRDTLTLLDQAIIYSKKFIDAKSVAQMLGVLDPKIIDDILNSILKNDKDRIVDHIKSLESYESDVIIDELIVSLKDRFFDDDPRFSPILIDRFFRILSQAKSDIYQNSDSGFLLTLILFKMIEATKIDIVDKKIDELESKLKIEPSSNAKEIKIDKKEEESISNEARYIENNDNRFEQLKDMISDRNYELGECFDKFISFVDFKNFVLELNSYANIKCQQSLREHYSIIKYLVQEIYGVDTKLKVNKFPPKEDVIKDIKKEEEQTKLQDNSSPNSCVANEVIGKSDIKELESENILDDPFVKKATELFEPSKIVVKSKI